MTGFGKCDSNEIINCVKCGKFTNIKDELVTNGKCFQCWEESK